MNDRVLLITGASGGFGAAVARAAAASGWRLALAARRADRLEALAAELGGPERALPIACDVTEWDQVEAMAAAARAHFGGIDAVFVNAGFGAARGFLAESPEQWRSMILTNVYGAAITIRATVDDLRARRGHVVLTGSVAGEVNLPGSVYSATKWAVSALSESARMELTSAGVRVTLIAPGAVATEFWDDPPAGMQMLTADDIAGAVMFALDQPEHVAVNHIVVRPRSQET